MEFTTSENSYKPIKRHWLGNASKVKYGCKMCEKVEFGLCWLFPKIFTPVPPFQLINYCQTQLIFPTNCKTLKFTQQNQQSFPGIRNSSRNLHVGPKYALKKVTDALTANTYPTREPPSPSLEDVESNAHVAYCFVPHLSLHFEA